jgi:hypothetical protein
MQKIRRKKLVCWHLDSQRRKEQDQDQDQFQNFMERDIAGNNE